MGSGRKTKNKNEEGQKSNEQKPYVVSVSLRFLYLSLASTVLLAFTIGRAARTILIEGPRQALLSPHDQSAMFVRPDYHEVGTKKSRGLPPPVLLDGKQIPRTIYTSKNFDTAASTVASLLLEESSDSDSSLDGNKNQNACSSQEDDSKECPRGKDSENIFVVDEEEHLPAGQHLLVDIKNVDGNFLNSAERLATAMVDLIAESRLTLLSYHCHSLLPTGVSCVGVLLESHVSFHTWPEEGVITLDLFTCGSGPLIPVLTDVERLFGIPQQSNKSGQEVDSPVVVWGHILRGFRTASEHIKFDSAYTADFGRTFLQDLTFDYKRIVSTNITNFQRIDVVEFVQPGKNSLQAYERSLSNDDSYESKHPELFQPERVVFLDGVLQSSSIGDEPYHESLVHPAMFAHRNPKRVAIVGGGECATLREVLKHKTIEKVTMIEIDEEMVDVSKKNIPAWSDCSDLEGSEDWCGDDKRADIRYEDALKWFLDRFLDPNNIQEEKLDIMIMDALDPQDNVQFADALYKNEDFIKAIYNSLADDGIIVMQIGVAPYSFDPPEQFSKQTKRDHLTNTLLKIGFQSLHAYEEAHCQFGDPWTFLVGFKDYKGRDMWFRNTAAIQLQMHERLLKTKSGKPTLKYFDGGTMRNYQIPHKTFEVVYCRQEPKPEDCYLLDQNFHIDSVVQHKNLEVRPSSTGVESGNGIFTKVDIQEGGIVSLKQMTDLVYLPNSSVRLITAILEECENAKVKNVYNYMYGYGSLSTAKGSESVFIESSILGFMNHGCNGSYNYGSAIVSDENAATLQSTNIKYQFNPFLDRHLYIHERGNYALRDIKAGEELLSNYLEPSSVFHNWGGAVEEIQRICSQEMSN